MLFRSLRLGSRNANIKTKTRSNTQTSTETESSVHLILTQPIMMSQTINMREIEIANINLGVNTDWAKWFGTL